MLDATLNSLYDSQCHGPPDKGSLLNPQSVTSSTINNWFLTLNYSNMTHLITPFAYLIELEISGHLKYRLSFDFHTFSFSMKTLKDVDFDHSTLFVRC